MTTAEQKHLSYTIARSTRKGDKLIATDEFACYRLYPAGTVITVSDFSNAGFDGMTVAGHLADGTFVHGMSAGKFRKA